ncbi:MAG: ABC transporter ATP-binding protein [Flavobacteriia bacterium]
MIDIRAGKIGYKKVLLEIQNLHLPSGSIHALIGANGAGKSTLLNTLTGKTKLLEGEISIAERNLNTVSERERSRLIAFVESSFSGVQYLRLEDYVLLGRSPYTDACGRNSKEDRRIATEAISLFGLDKYHNTDTSELSDGERQLAAIARAIAQDTPIILLDEPTAFLDYGNRKRLINELKKIALEKNKCILFSTHDIDLCIEEMIPVVLIDQETQQLIQKNDLIPKEEILSKGFNL